jgi:hypothetical protein
MIYFTIKIDVAPDKHDNHQEVGSHINSIIMVSNKAGSTFVSECVKWCYRDQHFLLDSRSAVNAWLFSSMKKEVYDNATKLFVKRNPYERFLSVWTFGHKNDPSSGTNYNDPGKRMWETHKEYNKYKPSELKPNMNLLSMTKKDWQKSFEEFCVTWDKGEIYDAHAHLMSKDLHLFPEDTFEFVEISELYNSKIYNKLFMEDAHRPVDEYISHPGDDGITDITRNINPSNRYLSNWKDYYNDNTKELVYKFMKQDFENLNYSEDF